MDHFHEILLQTTSKAIDKGFFILNRNFNVETLKTSLMSMKKILQWCKKANEFTASTVLRHN